MLKKIIGQATLGISRLILVLFIGLIATYAAEPEPKDEPEERYDHKRKHREQILAQWKGEVPARPEEGRDNEHVTKLSFFEKFIPGVTFDPTFHLPNIAFLFRFPNLTDLDLEGCKCIKDSEDAAVLGRLTQLRSLNLRCAFIPTLRPLRHLTHLTSLDLANNNITRIRPIIDLPLRNLNLDRCTYVRDVGLLRNVTTLTSLNLCMVFDNDDIAYPPLEFLLPLVNLRRLVLSSNDWISDLTPLQTLPRLTYLDVTGVKSLRDLSSIGQIPSLRFLKATELPHIKQIDFLGTLPRLRLLLVDDGMIVTSDHAPTLKVVYRKKEVTRTSSIPTIKTSYITK